MSRGNRDSDSLLGEALHEDVPGALGTGLAAGVTLGALLLVNDVHELGLAQDGAVIAGLQALATAGALTHQHMVGLEGSAATRGAGALAEVRFDLVTKEVECLLHHAAHGLALATDGLLLHHRREVAHERDVRGLALLGAGVPQDGVQLVATLVAKGAGALGGHA